MLNGALRACGLEFYFRHVLSVESVGCYKPDLRVYELAVSETGTSLEEIVFVSANAWDVAGAASFGLRVVWVNRSQAGSDDPRCRPLRSLRWPTCQAVLQTATWSSRPRQSNCSAGAYPHEDPRGRESR